MKIIATSILSLIYISLVFSSQGLAAALPRFVILHELGLRDNVYFTIESDGDFPDVDSPVLMNEVELFKLTTPGILKVLFPGYDQATSTVAGVTVIHLFKHSNRTNVLDEKLPVNLSGTFYDLIQYCDHGRRRLTLDGLGFTS